MNGQDIEIAQMKAYKSMEESNKNALEKDIETAEHIKEYEMELAKEMVRLRADGTPASMVERVARGSVAEIKFNASVAEAEARASKENINIKKKIFDSLEATKKRELG